MYSLKSFSERLFRLIYPHQNPAQVKREYGLPETINFNIRLTSDGWFVVHFPDLPGVVTQARSHGELIEMINDAVLTYYDVPRRKADIVYDSFNLNGEQLQYQAELKTRHA